MPGLEELFAFGSITKEFEIGTNKIRLTVLDAKHLQDALNASFGLDEVAKLLDYKKQVLARAITHCNGQTYVVDPNDPKQDEVEKTLGILNKFHVVLINQLYDFYDELDGEVKTAVDDKVKK